MRVVARSLATVLLLLPPGARASASLDEPLKVRFDEPTAVSRIYEAVGKSIGLRFVLDEGVRSDEKVSVDLAGLSVGQALDLLDLQLGLFRAEVEEGLHVVAPDNTSKRREYEIQAVQTFYLEHASVKSVSALLRGVLDVRKTAVDENTNSVTVRDEAAKIALAAELIHRFDVPPAEAEIEVEAWLLEPARADELREVLGRAAEGGGSGLLVERRRLDALRRKSGVNVAVRSTLLAPEGERLRLELTGLNLSRSPSGKGAWRPAALALQARPRIHVDPLEVTLDLALQLELETAPEAGAASDVPTTRSLESSARVPSGRSLVLLGLVAARDADGRAAEPGASASRELAVILSPRVTRLPEIGEDRRARLSIGTDRRLRGPGR
jgi:type II secretory pathway component GspD/PulD (secretin)